MNKRFDTLSFLSACLLACATTVLANDLSATAAKTTGAARTVYSSEFVKTFNEECTAEINNYFEDAAVPPLANVS